MRAQTIDPKDKILRDLKKLPAEQVQEILDFITFLKSKNKKIKRPPSRGETNPLLSIIGIGKSKPPHDTADKHDQYVYDDL